MARSPAARLVFGCLLLAVRLPALAGEPIRVAGQVRTVGLDEPLVGATVELYAAAEGFTEAVRRLTERREPAPLATARTDDEGAFEILAPESGCYRLVLHDQGYLTLEHWLVPLVEDTELPAAQTTLVVPLTVRTVGADGRALAGIAVRLLDPSSASARGESPLAAGWRLVEPRAVSDEKGRAVLSWFFSNPTTLVADSPRYLGQKTQVNVQYPPREPGAPLTAELRLAASVDHGLVVRGADGTLAPPRRVSGQVVDARSRRPVAGALVWSGEPPSLRSVRSDAAGAFQIELPAGEESWLEAAAAGFLPGARLPVKKGAAEPLVLAIPRAALLSGVVVDGDGRPIAGARLALHGSSSARRRSRSDGGFRFAGLQPGAAFEIVATHAGYARTAVAVRTAPIGQTGVPLRVVMADGQIAFGRVVDPAGHPLPAAQATLVNAIGESQSAVADDEGRFEFRHLSPGRVSLAVSHPGFAPVLREDLAIPAHPGRVDLGTVTLLAGEAIEGRVTDNHGNPLEGADVALLANGFVRGIGRREMARRLPQVKTGPDGSFRADGLEAGGRFDVSVRKTGFAEVNVASVVAPTREPLRIEMFPARTLAGRVVGPEGEPVGGAELKRIEETRIGSSMSSATTTLGNTEADGRFRVTGLPPGSMTLLVTAEGYAGRRVEGLQLPVESDVEDLSIVLLRGAGLDVRVLSAGGEPVADVWVQAIADPQPAAARVTAALAPSSAQTDPSGRCRLTVAEPGTYRVAAFDGAQTAETRVTAGPGSTPVELRLPPGVEISGRVAGTGDVELGTQVLLQGDAASFSTGTDAAGRFLFRGVADGSYRLSARREDRSSEPLELEIAGQPVRNLELRLDRPPEPATSLTGHLRGLAPEELAAAQVTAFRLDGASQYGVVDRDGVYRIADLKPGEWTIQAMTADGRNTNGTIQIAAGAPAATLDLEFPAGFTLTGRVLVDGRPLARAQVDVRTSGGAQGGSRTAYDGTFILRGLAPGALTLLIADAQGLGGIRTLALTEDQEIIVELSTGRLAGKISTVDGEPVEDATVSVDTVSSEPATSFSVPGTRSGADGGFEIPRLVEGTYRLTIEKEGFAPVEESVEVHAGAGTAAEIVLRPRGDG